MEALPKDVLNIILSNISDARDVAACNLVSKSWKSSMQYIITLHFPVHFYNYLTSDYDPNDIILRVISSIARLEKLKVDCPFTARGLASWLSLIGPTLHVLDLKVDNLLGYEPRNEASSKLDHITVAKNLESLVLWGDFKFNNPKWDSFQKLTNLEIDGARMDDSAISSALRACPNLSSLSLFRCRGLSYVAIEMSCLNKCKLDFYGGGNCWLLITAPQLQFLEVQGCSWIKVRNNRFLRSLSIANNSGRVNKLDFGKLEALETLSMRGDVWSWEATDQMLEMASEMKHLNINVESTGDFWGNFALSIR